MAAQAPVAAGAAGGLTSEADFDDKLLEMLMSSDIDVAVLSGLDWPGGALGRGAGGAEQEAAAPLRCLDSTHDAARCTRCTPAPLAEVEEGYVLASDATLPPEQRGLKGLRAALLGTREWNSSVVRNALADAAEADGDPHGLAPLLRDKRARHLGKVHLLAMCRAWGYSSYHWKPRGDVKRKRRGSRVAAAATTHASATVTATALVPRLPTPVAPDARSVAALLRERFAPELADSACALAGPRALAAARSTGVAPFAAENVCAYSALAASVSGLAAALAQQAVAQASWSAGAVRCADTLPGYLLSLEQGPREGQDAGSPPAWRVLPFMGTTADEPSPVEAMLSVLGLHLGTAVRWSRRNLEARLALLASSSGAASGADVTAALPQEIASLYTEFLHGLRTALAVEAEARALLAHLRATAPLADYAAAAEQLAAMLARYAADAAAALSQRAIWARDLVQQDGLPLQPSLPISVVSPAWDALAAAYAPCS